MKLKLIAAAALCGGALVAASPAFAQAQEKLTVWWEKGFYKAEDDALYAAIKKFEAKYPKYQGRPVAVRAAGDHPQDASPRWTPATRPTWPTATSTTSRSRPSGPSTASSRT